MPRIKVRPLIFNNDHVLVRLTKNAFAKIDIEDAALIGSRNWQYSKGYATRKGDRSIGEPYRVYMHRLINKTGMFTDHINMDRLDNRRRNLRDATYQQNVANTSKKGVSRSSKYKGVNLDKNRKGLWVAKICFNRKYQYLGRFKNEVDAARAYDVAAVKLFGVYARPNFLWEAV